MHLVHHVQKLGRAGDQLGAGAGVEAVLNLLKEALQLLRLLRGEREGVSLRGGRESPWVPRHPQETLQLFKFPKTIEGAVSRWGRV